MNDEMSSMLSILRQTKKRMLFDLMFRFADGVDTGLDRKTKLRVLFSAIEYDAILTELERLISEGVITRYRLKLLTNEGFTDAEGVLALLGGLHK